LEFLKNQNIKYLIIILVLILGYFGYSYYQKHQQEKALAEQTATAHREFEPIFKQLDEQIAEAQKSGVYDIDKTIRTMQEIDDAVANVDNIQDYLLKISKQDYRGVAPDVLIARKKILNAVMKLYSKQAALKDQPNYWEVIKQFTLATGSGINAAGVVTMDPTGALKYDPEMVKKTYQNYLDSKVVSDELKNEIRNIKSTLLSELYNYSETFFKYYDEWDKVCLLRDRAYLASKNGQWNDVVTFADQAIQVAPYDREAHLIKAMGMVAKMPSGTTINLNEKPTDNDETVKYLDEFIANNPSYTAPALLLKGVYYHRKGDLAQAKSLYEASAANYPRQADYLLSMYDPYKMRSYLRKSNEGNAILESYKSMMLGGGFYTPDLQLAKMYYEQGNATQGREKVLDHFSRRRNQSQWDYIISDIEFCERYFGSEFNKILPENFFLELVVKPTTFGNKLDLAIKNNSDKRLTNATLILCVQFTDMMRGDYITHKVSKTLPVLIPHQSNDFETEEISYNLFGVDKKVEDIVMTRAILISDEAVNWVDTDEFKFEKIKGNKSKNPVVPTDSKQPLNEELSMTKETVINLIKQNAKLSITSSTLSINDQINISMPQQLAFLHPIFRLSKDGKVLIEPTSNDLTSKNINLAFKLNKLETKDQKTYTTNLFTKLGNFVVYWTKDKSGKMVMEKVVAVD
jgi:hypothetical protein